MQHEVTNVADCQCVDAMSERSHRRLHLRSRNVGGVLFPIKSESRLVPMALPERTDRSQGDQAQTESSAGRRRTSIVQGARRFRVEPVREPLSYHPSCLSSITDNPRGIA